MKKELQNLVARYNKQKRDVKGRFTSGSGGAKFPKNFNWGRALPVILVVALVGGYLVYQSLATTTPITWQLYWSDEFNGTSLDTSRWGAYYNTYGDGNKEEACLTPNNVTVSSGSLKITSKKENITCPGSTPDQFSSGFIGSRDAKTANYYPAFARYEIRAKVPHGQGLWPAFWLRHVAGSGVAEVDVMEYFHAQVPGKVTQTLHIPKEIGRNIAKKSTFFETPRPGVGDYHTYTVDIVPLNNNTEAEFVYYIDGNETLRYKPSKFGWLNNYDKNKMFDIAINTAVGGTWNGHPDDPLGWSRYLNYCLNPGNYGKQQPCNGEASGVLRAQLPSSYEVDYVRVYVPSTGTVTPPAPTKLSTPTNFAVQPVVNGAQLSWSAPTDSRITSYSTRYIRSDSTTKSDGSTWTYPGRVSSTSTTISGLQPGVSYDFQVHSTDDTSTYPSSDYTSTITGVPLPEPTGLVGTYYVGTGWNGTAITRTDQTINFDWGWGSPMSGIGIDFATRWSGQLIAPKTETYTFTTASDDGMTLWINGKQLINSWKNQILTEKSATIQLEAGKAYDIEVDYYDSAAGAIARLYWSSPSISRQIVPASVLRPVVKAGLSGRYYSSTSVLRYDPTINFNWGQSAPTSLTPSNNFITHWIGKIAVPTTGTYTFTIESDDAAGVWINGTDVVHDWTAHAVRQTSGTIYLEAGKSYPISMYYGEVIGDAVARLLWSGPGISTTVVPSSALRSN